MQTYIHSDIAAPTPQDQKLVKPLIPAMMLFRAASFSLSLSSPSLSWMGSDCRHSIEAAMRSDFRRMKDEDMAGGGRASRRDVREKERWCE